MFTVLVITGNSSVVEFSGVHHFATLAQAQAFQPQGTNCSVECAILRGQLSEDQAITEYLD